MYEDPNAFGDDCTTKVCTTFGSIKSTLPDRKVEKEQTRLVFSLVKGMGLISAVSFWLHLYLNYSPTLDIFEINGKVTELPVSVYANFSETDVWTFTLNAAPAFEAVKPLIAIVVAFFLLA